MKKSEFDQLLYTIFDSKDISICSPDEFVHMFKKGPVRFFGQLDSYSKDGQIKLAIVLYKSVMLQVNVDKYSDNSYKLCVYFINLIDEETDCGNWVYKTYLPLIEDIKSSLHLWPGSFFDNNIFIVDSNHLKNISLIFLSTME